MYAFFGVPYSYNISNGLYGAGKLFINVPCCRRIHPRDKYDVAERLALAARSVAYGEKNIDFQGPFPSRITESGATLTIEYDHATDPIAVRSNSGFEVS